ncbi:MAG TPA: hypothetical protein PLN41_08260, partial [Methanothrix sp.]|nr:hypothetical protein [Methanothrix sp.]
MAPEAVKHIDLLSFDLADDPRLFGHLYYMAGDPVLHPLARRNYPSFRTNNVISKHFPHNL